MLYSTRRLTCFTGFLKVQHDVGQSGVVVKHKGSTETNVTIQAKLAGDFQSDLKGQESPPRLSHKETRQGKATT